MSPKKRTSFVKGYIPLGISAIVLLMASVVTIGYLGFTFGVNHFLIPSGELKIAVVDGTRLKKEAKIFHDVHQLLISEQSKAFEEIAPLENQLIKDQEEIRLEEKTNPENAKKRADAFEKRMSEAEQKVQKKRALLEKQRDYLSDLIERTVFKIIDEISTAEKINVVFNKTIEDKNAIFYVEKRMDLTDKVIVELDKRLKDIQPPQIKE